MPIIMLLLRTSKNVSIIIVDNNNSLLGLSFSWKVDSYSAGLGILSFHGTQRCDPILSQLNPIHTFTPVLSYQFLSPKCFLPLRFLDQNSIWIYHFPCTLQVLPIPSIILSYLKYGREVKFVVYIVLGATLQDSILGKEFSEA